MSALNLEDNKVICEGCQEVYPATALFCPGCGVEKKRVQEQIDPLVGTTVAERYHLLERTTESLSGVIYKARHVMLKKNVAVKVLHLELSQDELAIERFRREATTVGELDNKHIVEIHDFGRMSDGRLYLAMEFLDGETLEHIFAREIGMDVERVVHILSQLGEALMEAHAMGYIHRDLRPGNIMLCTKRSKPDFVKLLDFGLAKLVEREGEAASTSLGMTFGDPHYMSPEQAKGNPIDRRADIYSMGCIAYQMLAGRPPFHGGKIFDVLMRQVDEAPTDVRRFRDDVPDWLGEVVMRCLAKEPDERFVTVYRLIQALQQGEDSGTVMSDAVAKRPATVQPPSVERAIEKLGKRAPSSGPVFVQAANAEDHGAIKSEIPHELSEKLDPPTPMADEATGKKTHVQDPSESRNSSISAAWYADGETLESGDLNELDEQAKRRLEQARVRRPSEYTPVEYAEEPSRIKFYIGLIGGIAALLLAGWFLFGSGDRKESAEVEAVIPEMGTELEAPSHPALVADAGMAEETIEANTVSVPVVEAPPKETLKQESKVVAAAEPIKPKDRVKSTKIIETPPKEVAKDEPAKKKSEAIESKPVATVPVKESKPEKTKPIVDPEALRDPPDLASKEETNVNAKSDAKTFIQEGKDSLRSGDTLAAATSFQKAKELDPNNADAHLGLGEIALSQGSYRGAVTHLKKATKLRSSHWRGWMLLGEAELSAGNMASAEQAFKNSLKINPDNARARDGYNQAIGLE